MWTAPVLVDDALKGPLLFPTFTLGGIFMLLTPEQARAKGTLQVLDAMQVRRLYAG